jgi:photosystem II stability/assembly factor-like uncharacterized protein
MKNHLLLIYLLFSFSNFFAQAWPSSTKVFDSGIGIMKTVATNKFNVWAYGMGVNSRNQFTEDKLSLAKSNDGGITWEVVDFPKPKGGFMSNLTAINKDIAWVSYNQFDDQTKSGVVLFKTLDGGTTWNQQKIGMEVWINAVYFYDSNNGIALGDPNDKGFEIYTTADGGEKWTKVSNDKIPLHIDKDEYGTSGLFSIDQNKIAFPTTKGRIITSDDKGNTWRVMTLPSNETLRFSDFFYDSNGNGYSIFSGFLNKEEIFSLYRTSDNGLTWKNITPKERNVWLFNIEAIPNKPSIVGTFVNLNTKPPRQQTRLSHDNGESWTTIDTSTFIWETNFVNPAVGYGISRVWNKHNEIYKFNSNVLTGIFDPKPIDATLNIYPNPANNIATIHISSTKVDDYDLYINDLQGRLVYKKFISKTVDHHEKVELSNLTSGMYILTLSNKEGVATKKFVKE